jgi:hypothetical protein
MTEHIQISAVARAPTSASNADLTLPEPAPGKAIGWNADGSGLTNDPAEFAVTLAAVDAAAAAASGSAASASGSAASASASASAASASASTVSAAAAIATTQAGITTAKAVDAEASAGAALASETAAGLSETAAAASAATATTQAGIAATKAGEASTSAADAASAKIAAEAARDSTLAAFDSFDDRYLGAQASDPVVDNDGNALVAGSIYFNTASGAMKVHTGSAWVAAYVSGAGYLAAANNLSDLSSAATARTSLGLGTAATTAASDYATAAQGAKADGAAPAVHTHTAADIASGTIATARLGSGSAGSSTYLRGDQTWAAVSAGAWEFVSSTTASGAATVDFTGLVSGYDYMVVFDGVYTGSGQELGFRFGTAGPAYQTSGYQEAMVAMASSSSPGSGNSGSGLSTLKLSNNGSNVASTADGYVGHVFIPNPSANAYHKIYGMTASRHGPTGELRNDTFSGYRSTQEVLVAVRFHDAGGTGVSGTFILYRGKRSA